ncbi:urease accessory protein UreD [Cellulosimicrobium arenosum]|uniref:Urease accessory protein UreD n=1 Tax=Cellulosimicrobium arenosum TaxID=2708133 RepID=A0A927G9E2_9MICO|nr:urease accessory protein UreD [Cellulosimicrobium arenosum]MBD8079070.1 urease accessory protein UreD [Cellulosimicrobium arenosum]
MTTDTTRVEVHASSGRVRLDLRPGALSPRVLSTGPGVARVALVATRALLLGGDDVRIEVVVGDGVELELVEVSGTVAYNGRGRSSSWAVDVRVDDGGLLVWDALPFVVAQGADVERRTDVRLGEGAVALLRETLVLGRTGETGGRLRSRTIVDLSAPRHPRDSRAADDSQQDELSVPREPLGPRTADGSRELFVEDLDLRDDRTLPGILGDGRVVDSVLLAGARPPAAGGADEPGARTPSYLRLDLAGPGAVARHLGASTHDAGLDRVVAAWVPHVRTTRPDARTGETTGAVRADRPILQTTGA